MKQGLESQRRDERFVPEQILRFKRIFPIDLRWGKAPSKTVLFTAAAALSIKPSPKLLPFSNLFYAVVFLKRPFQNSSGSHTHRATTLQRLSVVPYNYILVTGEQEWIARQKQI